MAEIYLDTPVVVLLWEREPLHIHGTVLRGKGTEGGKSRAKKKKKEESATSGG